MCSAPRIRAGADSLKLETAPICTAAALLPCLFRPPPHLPEGYAIPPTHLLLLEFDRLYPFCPSDDDEPEQLLVPIHEQVWALRCSQIARFVAEHKVGPTFVNVTCRKQADSDADFGEALVVHMPVVPLPCSQPAAALSTFTLLHTYLHTSELPAHLPSPNSRPDDKQDAGCEGESGDQLSEPEEEEEDEDEKEEAAFRTARVHQCEALREMCQGFGLADSDPIYSRLSSRWQGAVPKPPKRRMSATKRRIATRNRTVPLRSPPSATRSTSRYYLPSPPPG
ncbi:hypothetical protein JCM3774_001768 [Rhodotorula dairenensis]